MTKLVYIGDGDCEFCRTLRDNYPEIIRQEKPDLLVQGRIYTEQGRFKVTLECGLKGEGVRVYEYPLPYGWGTCSCRFREVDGDSDTWKEMLRKHKSKPKTRELEPA